MNTDVFILMYLFVMSYVVSTEAMTPVNIVCDTLGLISGKKKMAFVVAFLILVNLQKN